MSNLAIEMETYQKLLPTLLTQEGKYALIAKETLLDVFSTYEDAIKAGYGQCGLQPFLVKRISVEDPIAYFTRDFQTPCPA